MNQSGCLIRPLSLTFEREKLPHELMAQAKQLEISLVISDLTTFSRFDLKENEIRLMLIFDVISNDIYQFISTAKRCS